MCEMDNSLQIDLLTEGRPQQALPEHPRIAPRAILPVSRYLRPKRLWSPIIPPIRQLMRTLWTGRGEGQIWHSTYYTRPAHWQGIRLVTVHDMIYERFPEAFKDDQFRDEKRRCILESDIVISVSETTCQDLQHFYGLHSTAIHVIPNACSDVFRKLERYDTETKSQIRHPFLLYIGDRTRYYKNFDMLIRAYSVWTHREEIPLVVIGKDWSADEKKYLAESEIQDCAISLTNVDDKELCRLYNLATALVYPSLYEGFGIPLLEAMACGCPIVASRIPSTVETAGECPIYFDPVEIESLLAAFDIALSEGRDSERVQAGTEQVKRYSWDETARRTLEVYHTVCQP
jgi:glycosyltransferase involved in cell wall biosynthesis